MSSFGKGSNSSYETPTLNGLAFTQAQANFILGHSLASLYQELLNAPIPEHLKAIIDRLDDRGPSMKEGDNSS